MQTLLINHFCFSFFVFLIIFVFFLTFYNTLTINVVKILRRCSAHAKYLQPPTSTFPITQFSRNEKLVCRGFLDTSNAQKTPTNTTTFHIFFFLNVIKICLRLTYRNTNIAQCVCMTSNSLLYQFCPRISGFSNFIAIHRQLRQHNPN